MVRPRVLIELILTLFKMMIVALLRFPQSQSEICWKEDPRPWDCVMSHIKALEHDLSCCLAHIGNTTSTSSLETLKRSMLEVAATRSLC